LAQVLNRLLPAIERTHIDRVCSASFMLLIRCVCRIAVESIAGVLRNRLESAGGEGRERELSLGDLAVAVEIEPSVQ